MDISRIDVPEWGDKALKLYDQKVRVDKIADEVGKSESWIRSFIKLARPQPNLKDPHWLGQALSIIDADPSIAYHDLAKKLGVPQKRLEYHLRFRKTPSGRPAQKGKGKKVPDRQFTPVKEWDTTHRAFSVGVMVHCSKCNRTEKFIRAGGSVNPSHAANWFRNKGWIIGGGPRADLCPEHADKLASNGKIERQPEPIKKPILPALAKEIGMEQMKVTTVGTVAENVSEPPRSDWRVILAKLNEVYGDEKSYTADWSDEKVAKDLGVPVPWVEKVREDTGIFGPNVNEGALREQIAAFQTLRENYEKEFSAVQLLYKQIDSDYNALTAKVEALDKKFTELTKLHVDLKTKMDTLEV